MELNGYDAWKTATDWRELDEDECPHHLDYLCPECDCEMEPCVVGNDGTCPNPECGRTVDLFLVDRATDTVVEFAPSSVMVDVLSHECDSFAVASDLVQRAALGHVVNVDDCYLCDIGGVPLVGPVHLPHMLDLQDDISF